MLLGESKRCPSLQTSRYGASVSEHVLEESHEGGEGLRRKTIFLRTVPQSGSHVSKSWKNKTIVLENKTNRKTEQIKQRELVHFDSPQISERECS